MMSILGGKVVVLKAMESSSFDVVSGYTVVYGNTGDTWIVIGDCVDWILCSALVLEKSYKDHTVHCKVT